ncbi:hypothetical protein ACO2Q8_05155 [Larkinella sp. VNQ87]|uniref:hypothetical protein n=1 Tax=Larkinella sp. VNQ87 TaxID=3400921 RepID=UPI003C121010
MKVLFVVVGLLLVMADRFAETKPVLDLKAEQAAIRAVIAKETEAYYRQDFQAWRNCYVHAPYLRRYGYWEGYPNKVQIHNGFAALEADKKQQFARNQTVWQGSTEEVSNENFRIYPNVAWYTFDQVSYEKGSRKVLGRSVETRILEKHDGQWKIAYMGFHYLPQSNESAN